MDPPVVLFRLVHFNDAYVPTLAPRWATFAKSLDSSIVTCGGDVFNPSLLSSVTKGKHMPQVLNALNVKVAVVGNHDLDFGVQMFTKLAERCSFPWLASNINLPGCVEHVVLETNGVRVGFFGLVGTDYVSCLNFDASSLIVEDVVVCGKRMIELLEPKCDVIVALTHCRLFDDKRLASLCGGKFSMILGGHDHEVMLEKPVFKAGTDWQNALVCSFLASGDWDVQLVPIKENLSLIDDPDTSEVIHRFDDQLKSGLGRVLARLDAPLDVRTSLIRRAESPVGNWICDLVRKQFVTILGRPVDFCLINAGSFRGDKIYEDPFTVESLLSLLPFNDLTLGYLVSGARIRMAIEAGISKYPAEHGGFPCISGMKARLKGRKVISLQLLDNSDVKDDKEYVMVTKSFLAEDGKDGFECLKGYCKPLMDKDLAILLSSLVRSALSAANAVLLMQPRKDVSLRFIEKLRNHGKKKDAFHVLVHSEIDHRLIIEE